MAAGPAGRRILAVAAPFTEGWRDMLARDSRRLSEAGAAADPEPLLPPHTTTASRRHRGAAPARLPAFFPSPLDDLPGLTPAEQFPGGNRSDALALSPGARFRFPPDTMGAIGPAHFVQCINFVVNVYSRTGLRLGSVRNDSFFAVAQGGTTFPRNGVSDPRILFDPRSGRWFAAIIDFGQPVNHANDAILAVSRTADPTGVWDKYVLPVGVPDSGGTGFLNDYPTLGLDENGVYVGFNVYDLSYEVAAAYFSIVAAPKRPLVGRVPYLGAVTRFDVDDLFTPFTADNLDPVAPSDPAWILGLDPAAELRELTADLRCRTLRWRRGAPVLSDTFVLPTAAQAGVLDPPSLGALLPVDGGDSRLMGVTLRGHHLWTSHHVGVNGQGQADGADRLAAEWFDLDVSGPAPRISQTGRVFDPAGANPRSYFYPSIMVNGQDHALMGFSGSSADEYVGAYASSRLATDPPGTMRGVQQLQPGLGPYTAAAVEVGDSRNRWGDYSYTSVDPIDDMTFWTTQEYASLPDTSLPETRSGIWATWISQVMAPPPSLEPRRYTGRAGQRQTLLLRGTGFFEPGPGFPSHLQARIAGGRVNGTSNYRVLQVKPVAVTVAFDLSESASPGPRDVVLRNPDGQTAVLPGAFVVRRAP